MRPTKMGLSPQSANSELFSVLTSVAQFSAADMQSIPFFLFLIGFAGVVASCVRGLARGHEDGILPRVDEEFRALVVDSAVANLRFNGRTAEIVDERQEHSTDEKTNASTLVRIQRFARNEYGEYFFFISEGDGRPFFKHVSHSNAQIALGKKYVEPTQSIDD